MRTLTLKELHASAQIIVAEIKQCDTDQRWALYAHVAAKLRDSGQNFQAAHFNAIAAAELHHEKTNT